jgi:L-cysteine/cystine lyase
VDNKELPVTKRRQFIRDVLVGGLGVSMLSSFRIADDEPPKPGWNNVRSHFTFPEDYHYLNTGTMGLSPKQVTFAYKKAIDELNSSGKYDQYKAPLQQALAEFAGCSPNEIALTGNVTEGINVAVWSLPLKEGDEVILSDQEHAGNAIPWLNRAKRDGLKISIVKIGKTGSETLANLAKLSGPRTKVIALPHICCTTGTILPISGIVSLARGLNAYTVIDGAHGAGMLNLNLDKMGVDFYSSCFHKWMLGPKGSGWLYVNRNQLGMIASAYVGAHSDAGWSFEDSKVEYKGIKPDTAMRYTYGTQSDPLFAASLASIKFLNDMGMSKVAKKIKSLGSKLCEDLLEIPTVEVLNSVKKREHAGIISFRPLNSPLETVLTELSAKKFRVREVRESGMDCIRISTHIYNTEEEINELVSLIRTVTNAH